MSFQVGIGSLGGTVFSGGTFYPSVNHDMFSPKNFAEFLKLPILQNASGWLLLKYLKIKLAAMDKLLVMMRKIC